MELNKLHHCRCSAFPLPPSTIETRPGFFHRLACARYSATSLLVWSREPLTPRDFNRQRHLIATGPFDYAYPYAIQTRDGKIRIVYISHERTQVNHAVFDESAITGK